MFGFPEGPAAAGADFEAAAVFAVGEEAGGGEVFALQGVPQGGEELFVPLLQGVGVGVWVAKLGGLLQCVEVKGTVFDWCLALGGAGLPIGEAIGGGADLRTAAVGGPGAVAADEGGGLGMGVGHFVPQPKSVDGEFAFGLAALVDGVFVQPHLDFGLALQPLPALGAGGLGQVGVLAGDVEDAGGLPGGGAGQADAPQLGGEGGELPAVFAAEGVEAVAQHFGFFGADVEAAALQLGAVQAELLVQGAGEGVGFGEEVVELHAEVGEAEIGRRGGRSLEAAET